MTIVERLKRMETRPINFVFQVKFNKAVLPIEFGFTNREEAVAAREEFEYSLKNNPVSWTDLKEQEGFDHTENAHAPEAK